MVLTNRATKFLRVLQSLDVGDYLVRFDPEAEMVGCLSNPFLGSGLLQQLPEGEVHLNRIQLAGVVGEELRLREFLRDRNRVSSLDTPTRRYR